MRLNNIYFLFLFLSIVIFPQQFKLIGPPGGIVEQKQIVLNSNNPKVFYIAQSNGSLFKSINGTSIINSVEVGFGNFSNQKIWLSPENTNILFINNLFYLKTTDGGNNWNVLIDQAYRMELTFNPIDPNIIYFSDYSDLYRSNDLGETRKLLYTFDRDITDITISKTDTSKFYLSTSSRKLYRSTNSGKDWELRNTENVFMGDPRQIEISPYNDNTVYVNAGGIYKSNDGGKTFSVHLEVRNLSAYAVNPLDTLTMYAAVGDYIFEPEGGIIKTTNEGEEWFDPSPIL